MSRIGMASETLYADFFGLSERPFTLVPDPSFIYWSEQHKRAFAVLEFGIMSRAPITLITGEIGSGKTTLLQELLSPDGHIGDGWPCVERPRRAGRIAAMGAAFAGGRV